MRMYQHVFHNDMYEHYIVYCFRTSMALTVTCVQIVTTWVDLCAPLVSCSTHINPLQG